MELGMGKETMEPNDQDDGEERLEKDVGHEWLGNRAQSGEIRQGEKKEEIVMDRQTWRARKRWKQRKSMELPPTLATTRASCDVDRQSQRPLTQPRERLSQEEWKKIKRTWACMRCIQKHSCIITHRSVWYENLIHRKKPFPTRHCGVKFTTC